MVTYRPYTIISIENIDNIWKGKRVCVRVDRSGVLHIRRGDINGKERITFAVARDTLLTGSEVAWFTTLS